MTITTYISTTSANTYWNGNPITLSCDHRGLTIRWIPERNHYAVNCTCGEYFWICEFIDRGEKLVTLAQDLLDDPDSSREVVLRCYLDIVQAAEAERRRAENLSVILDMMRARIVEVADFDDADVPSAEAPVSERSERLALGSEGTQARAVA